MLVSNPLLSRSLCALAILATLPSVTNSAFAQELIPVPKSSLPAVSGSNAPTSPPALAGLYFSYVLSEESIYQFVGSFEVGDEVGGELPIVGGSSGSGYIVPDAADAGHYMAHFAALDPYVIDLDYSLERGGFEFSIGGATGLVLPNGGSYSSDPGPYDPSIGCGRHGTGMTFWVDTNGLPWVYDVDFIQFSSISITFEVVSDTGQHFVVPAEPDPQPVTGNGGFSHHDPATGQGFEVCDGSRVYVDSGKAAEPKYIAAGGWGETANGVTSMIDNPGPSADDLKAMTTATQAGLDPGWTIESVSFYITFSTYLLINDEVAWVWHWEYSCYYDPATDAYYANSELSDDGPASSMSPSEQAALSNFQGGGFAGAPNP